MSFWKGPSSSIKYSEELWHCLNYYFNSKQWQNKLNKTNRTKINKKKSKLPGHLPGAAHLAAHWPAQHCAGPCQPPASSRQAGREERARARRAHHAAPWLPAPLGQRGDASKPLLGTAPTPPTPHSPPGSLPRPLPLCPSAAVAAACRCRVHRRPLAP